MNENRSMPNERDMLMAKLIGGMILGLEKTTAALEEVGNEKHRRLIEQNKQWLADVRETLGMDRIL